MFRIVSISFALLLYLLCYARMKADATVLGYWAFDDKKDLGKDSSRFDNHGESKKEAVYTPKGKVGGGLQLDGTNWLEVPHHNSLNVKDQVTLMCWVNFEPDGASQDQSASLIFKNGPFILEGDKKDRRFWASYPLVKVRERQNIGTFAFEANTTEGRTITAPGDPDATEANRWYHIAGVADGTQVKIYTNGKKKAEAEQKGEFKPSEQPLTIGFDLRVSPEKGGRKPYLIGIIDEVIIIDKALTKAQVEEAMELGENGKTLDNFQEIFAVEFKGKLATKWAEIKAQN